MKPWQSMLIGLGVALVMILLSLPITLYMAFDRDNSLKPASLGVFAMWLCLIVTGAVGGYLWPKILGSVERKEPAARSGRPVTQEPPNPEA